MHMTLIFTIVVPLTYGYVDIQSQLPQYSKTLQQTSRQTISRTSTLTDDTLKQINHLQSSLNVEEHKNITP